MTNLLWKDAIDRLVEAGVITKVEPPIKLTSAATGGAPDDPPGLLAHTVADASTAPKRLVEQNRDAICLKILLISKPFKAAVVEKYSVEIKHTW